VMSFDKQVYGVHVQIRQKYKLTSLFLTRPQDVWHDGLVPVDFVQANDFHTQAGYVVNASTRFYQCPVSGACLVNSTTGGVACASGSTGVLCSQCNEQYMKSTLGSGRCILCPPNALADVIWPWFAFAGIVVAGRAFWLHGGKRVWSKVSQKLLPGKNMQPVVLFKIVLSFYQGETHSAVIITRLILTSPAQCFKS
jgi:hypothetical protein